MVHRPNTKECNIKVPDPIRSLTTEGPGACQTSLEMNLASQKKSCRALLALGDLAWQLMLV
jgi:hypothetical protein